MKEMKISFDLIEEEKKTILVFSNKNNIRIKMKFQRMFVYEYLNQSIKATYLKTIVAVVIGTCEVVVPSHKLNILEPYFNRIII